jgi:hypothetical protein
MALLTATAEAGLILVGSARYRDTELMDTPAKRATSFIVVIRFKAVILLAEFPWFIDENVFK